MSPCTSVGSDASTSPVKRAAPPPGTWWEARRGAGQPWDGFGPRLRALSTESHYGDWPWAEQTAEHQSAWSLTPLSEPMLADSWDSMPPALPDFHLPAASCRDGAAQPAARRRWSDSDTLRDAPAVLSTTPQLETQEARSPTEAAHSLLCCVMPELSSIALEDLPELLRTTAPACYYD